MLVFSTVPCTDIWHPYPEMLCAPVEQRMRAIDETAAANAACAQTDHAARADAWLRVVLRGIAAVQVIAALSAGSGAAITASGALSWAGHVPDATTSCMGEGIYPLVRTVKAAAKDGGMHANGLIAIAHAAQLHVDTVLRGLLVLAVYAAAYLCLSPWSGRQSVVRCVLALFVQCVYVCVCATGREFMSFQWDALLNEAGLLAALAYAMPPPQRSVRTLFRVLIVKLMGMSGVVKLLTNTHTHAVPPSRPGGAPTSVTEHPWLDCTATQTHFATQCLPSPGALLLHVCPPLILALSTAIVHVIETGMALPMMATGLLMVQPMGSLARVAVFAQLVLQGLIMLTGNYTFFNLLTCVLALACLEEKRMEDVPSPMGDGGTSRWRGMARKLAVSWSALWRHETTRRVVTALCAAGLLIGCIYAFELHDLAPASDAAWWLRYTVRVRLYGLGRGDSVPHTDAVRLNIAAIEAWTDAVLPWIAVVCIALILYHALVDVASTFLACFRDGCGTRMRRGLACRTLSLCGRSARALLSLAAITAACVFGGASVVTLLTLRSETMLREPSPMPGLSVLIRAYYAVQPWHGVSGYGLFRSMTGLGLPLRDAYGIVRPTTARPELVIQAAWPRHMYEESPDILVSARAKRQMGEASSIGDDVWLDVELPYKPGDPDRAPPVIAPFQPRLDWQMWFAALDTGHHSPWMLRLVHGILSGSPAVHALLDGGAYPIKAHIPADEYGGARVLRVPPSRVRVLSCVYDLLGSGPVPPWMVPVANRTLPGDASLQHRSRHVWERGRWWSRTCATRAPGSRKDAGSHYEVHEYLPSLDASNAQLVQALKQVALPPEVWRDRGPKRQKPVLPSSNSSTSCNCTVTWQWPHSCVEQHASSGAARVLSNVRTRLQRLSAALQCAADTLRDVWAHTMRTGCPCAQLCACRPTCEAVCRDAAALPLRLVRGVIHTAAADTAHIFTALPGSRFDHSGGKGCRVPRPPAGPRSDAGHSSAPLLDEDALQRMNAYSCTPAGALIALLCTAAWAVDVVRPAR